MVLGKHSRLFSKFSCSVWGSWGWVTRVLRLAELAVGDIVVRLYDLPHHPRCFVWSFFFISPSSSIYLMRRRLVVVSLWRRRASIPQCFFFFGDVNSSLPLADVAHAHVMRWSNSPWTEFLRVTRWPRYFCWQSDPDVHLSNCFRVTFFWPLRCHVGDELRCRGVQFQAVCRCGCGEVVHNGARVLG